MNVNIPVQTEKVVSFPRALRPALQHHGIQRGTLGATALPSAKTCPTNNAWFVSSINNQTVLGGKDVGIPGNSFGSRGRGKGTQEVAALMTIG